MGINIWEFNVTRDYISNDTRIRRDFAFASPVLVLLVVVMVLLIVVIVLGNALVILAFKMDRSLRRQSNYFLLNLAISDFLVGLFCVPVYLPYVLTGKWMLGQGVCKLWLVMDYLLCTASVFNIVLISYDRFLSVTRAVSYRARQGMTRRALAKMAGVWVLAFLLYGPAILLWEVVSGASHVPEDECFAEFFHTWYFLLCASTLEFFFPFLSVTFFNLSIYRSIRERRVRHGSDPRPPPSSQAGRQRLRLASCVCRGPLASDKAEPSAVERPAACGATGRNGSLSARSSQCTRLAQDKKIAKSLAIIVCVFALCWAPYTLLMIIRAACRGRCVSDHWYEVTFWLLWLNSAINPFLYPLCHSSFRRAFAKILCMRQRSTQGTSDHLSTTQR
ncbi:histamine H3 receptor [Brachyhypopomus gauderio]|uniref:histamine H3 receptor n=1 Tax=Brachyhypopomus gauderio TaxID=698409 RepID=UPI0040429EE0